MSIRPTSKAGGFTLIEVLVAMAILGVIIVAIYSSWMSIARGQKVGVEAAAEVQRARMAVQTIEDALAGAQMFTENMPLYAFNADTSDGDFAALAFSSHLPRSFPGNRKFPNVPLRGVAFHVQRDDDGNGNKLVLRQLPLLAALDTPAYEVTLAHNITLFRLEFLDTTINPPEWVEEWTLTNQVPACVKVALGFGTPGKPKTDTLISRTVNIPAVAVTRQYQAPDIAGGNPPNPGGNPGGNNNPGGSGNPGGFGNPGGGNTGGFGNPGGGGPIIRTRDPRK